MELVISIMILVLILTVHKIYDAFMVLVWQPFVLTKRFKKQGISGPKYRFLYGNLGEIKKMKKESELSILNRSSNDIFGHVLPHYQKWMSLYGETFLYWNGTEPRICISNPDIAKQILSSKLGFFVKVRLRPEIVKLIGHKGLVLVEGVEWVRHRRILNSGFSTDRLKNMTNVMVNCTLRMLEEWRKQRSEEEGDKSEIKKEMNREFQILTGDIIATAAFGSSYVEGIEVFKSLNELKDCCKTSLTKLFIPGTQYLPTPLNIRIWKLERKMDKSIMRIISSRLQSKSDYGNDLLGIMLKACQSEGNEPKMSIEEILHECRTFFFAGHETNSNVLSWITMLLSLHQDWQEKLREEIFKECGKDKTPDSDTFYKLKLMNMVIMESLRLYGPAPLLTRVASKDIMLGQLEIPKGTTITLPLLKIHNDKTLWGSDVQKFNPMRFANGVSKAANRPNALLAFSIGPRACIGQNFAMIETKTVLIMILQRFRLRISNEYKHAPVDHLTLKPHYGLPVMVQPL